MDLELRLGNAVREFRKELGWTQEQLAEHSKLHVTYIAGIETGKRNPSLKSIVALAFGLRISPSELLKRMEG